MYVVRTSVRTRVRVRARIRASARYKAGAKGVRVVVVVRANVTRFLQN